MAYYLQLACLDYSLQPIALPIIQAIFPTFIQTHWGVHNLTMNLPNMLVVVETLQTLRFGVSKLQPNMVQYLLSSIVY